MKVEIWSDYVCPFCYIGKRKFELGLQQFVHKDEITIEFRSFELDPNAPKDENISTLSMLASKYGMSLEQAKAMTANVIQQAAEVGLMYNFESMSVTNTFDSHRLAQYAAEQGKGSEMSERLLKAYFTDSDNIADHNRLVELAAEVGLDHAAVKEILSSNAYADRVRDQEEEGSRLGIRGVPYFVIDRKYAVSGAQSPAVFLDTLNKAWEDKYPALVQVEEDSDALCTDGACLPNVAKD